ncbi:MAG: undecaprenyl/decaprenyl-phosphate alpha-N-acetylglucosaminyl 1-phosphate transferase, partial [Spirochaetales bacterium]|nr:undecaprenyl/decaprenyl-phosphate alpha-N-acetylglucosaminyl 1-phosphate transferase [Spirochaetales bacterium]
LGGLPPLLLFGFSVDPGWIGYVLTVVALVWLLNLYNFMDGIDGIAGIEALSSTLVSGLLFLFIFANQEIASLNLLMFSAVTGFLIWNFPPAKIFMGDSGSLFLGFVLASLPLYILNDIFADYRLILGITFLLIPIYDTLGAIIRRKIRGVPFHSPDMDHLHHKLMAIGLSKPVILVLTAFTILILSGTALLFAVYRDILFIYLQLIEWLVVLFLFILISIRKSRKNKREQS